MTRPRRPSRAVPASSADAGAMFVRLPLPPEVVKALRGHADRIGSIVDRLSSASGDLSELVRDGVAAVAELERDAKRARRALEMPRRKR